MLRLGGHKVLGRILVSKSDGIKVQTLLWMSWGHRDVGRAQQGCHSLELRNVEASENQEAVLPCHPLLSSGTSEVSNIVHQVHFLGTDLPGLGDQRQQVTESVLVALSPVWLECHFNKADDFLGRLS